MSIDWTQIETIIRESSRNRTTGSKGDCPPLEDLVRFVERKLNRRSRIRTIEHLSGCDDCAKIVQSLLRLSREVDKLAEVPGRIQGSPSDLRDEEREIPKPPLGRRLALVGLVMLAGVAIISVFMIRFSERPVARGGAGSEIKLVNPKMKETLLARDIKFKWEAVPKATYYFVDIFGSSLEKISSTGPISEPSLEPAQDVLRLLVAGATYFWRVRAVTGEGQEVISKLSEYSIRK